MIFEDIKEQQQETFDYVAFKLQANQNFRGLAL
jgi:hypothetical protein